MSLEADIFTALNAISAFGGRVYPVIFPQSPTVPITPALRYTFLSGQSFEDICGTDDDAETDDTRTQIDIVSADFKTCRGLRLEVIAAMQALATPTRRDGPGFDSYDFETRLYRHTIDFISSPSSPS